MCKYCNEEYDRLYSSFGHWCDAASSHDNYHLAGEKLFHSNKCELLSKWAKEPDGIKKALLQVSLAKLERLQKLAPKHDYKLFLQMKECNRIIY